MKKLLSIILAITMVLSLMAVNVSAESIVHTNNESGNPYKLVLPKPAQPNHFVVHHEQGKEDELEMFFIVDKNVSELISLVDSDTVDFEKTYKTGKPSIYLQFDVSADSSDNWNYTEEWDKADWGIGYYSGYTQERLTTDRTDSVTLFTTRYFTEQSGDGLKVLAPVFIEGEGEYGKVHYIDTQNHSIHIRCRYFMKWEEKTPEDEWGDVQYQVGEWSDVAVVGKGSTQVIPQKPVGMSSPIISSPVVIPPEKEGLEAHLEFLLETPQATWDAELYYLMNDEDNHDELDAQISVNGAEWTDLYVANSHWPLYEGKRTCSSSEAITSESHVRFRARYGKSGEYSDWSNIIEVNAPEFTASPWASEELEKADALGLIPDNLKSEDLTKSITRAEFAAVAVKVYEALSGTSALPNTVNPFTDTSDIEVLKAYNLGITTGTSASTFDPATLLNREQAATMLTRTFKRATMNSWTIATDSSFPLTYTKPTAFADDSKISDWAKDSVYFMVANEVIKGVGNNIFAPKNVTSDEEARGYANATREQALIIAVRMVQNLKQD